MGLLDKFSQEIQQKIRAAFSNDGKIDEKEARSLGLSKENAKQLMRELSGDGSGLLTSDSYQPTIKNSWIGTPLRDTHEDETAIKSQGFEPITNNFKLPMGDGYEFQVRMYYNKDKDEHRYVVGMYKDGKRVDGTGFENKQALDNYLLTKYGVNYDKLKTGGYLDFNKDTAEIALNISPINVKNSTATEAAQGGFELTEGENFQRTNRRFAVALIKDMYNKAIKENLDVVQTLGVLDMGFWREALGMGVQSVADLFEGQEAITATTLKRVERMASERDKVCGELEKLIDKPSSFSDKFSQLVGKAYSDMNFQKLRDIRHSNEKSKDIQDISYTKCMEEFNKMYPDNRITKYLEGNLGTKILDKMANGCDAVADIIVMFMMTGGIGSLWGKAGEKSVQLLSKEILKDAAKGNYKKVIGKFAELTTNAKTQVARLAENNPKLAELMGRVANSKAAQYTAKASSNFVKGAPISAATMSTYEGMKTFVNKITNAEELPMSEILEQTWESIKGGAQMGAEMTGLQAFAIQPIMTSKLMSKALSKMTGATSQVSKLVSQSGEAGVSMQEVAKVYEDCAKSLRGVAATEGTHLGVTMGTMVPAFAIKDTALEYDEDGYRKQLLNQAKSQQERDEISKMSSLELRAQFFIDNLGAQAEGMGTIEGVSLAMRRWQAARLAGQKMKRKHINIVDANLRSKVEDGKTFYELVDADGKVLKIREDKKVMSKFSSVASATAAYNTLCMQVFAAFGAQNELEEVVVESNDKPLTPYTKAGNKIFAVKPEDFAENPAKIAEAQKAIDELKTTEPQEAEELQIVLDMFKNPPKDTEITDKQYNAVVKFLDDHYASRENYLNAQVDGANLNKLGSFNHRMKGVESTKDKLTNYINDAIKARQKNPKKPVKTLLDAYNDVRDKYACRTVFEKFKLDLPKFAKEVEVLEKEAEELKKQDENVLADLKIIESLSRKELIKLVDEANSLKTAGKVKEADAKMHEACERAAEIQSEKALETLMEDMAKAKEGNNDLSSIRISNYTSENGIPIFSERQLELLQKHGAKLDLDVSFIKLKKDIKPEDTKTKPTTKAQPSGYTALQVNFVTKAGEIIEWQFRGELVDIFAEAEHLPYDLRTGKRPWAQNPELEPLYKPIADLLREKDMPIHAYNQLNKYFTDYYTHLRKLELGFESKEPRLEDYENYRAKDENEVERDFSFKFDKRLEAKNLIHLHDIADGVKNHKKYEALKQKEAEGKLNAEEKAELEKLAEKRKIAPEKAVSAYAKAIGGKILEGGVLDTELTEVASFAKRLIGSKTSLVTEKNIKEIERALTERMNDKTSEEERLQVQNIINKVTPENLELINMMIADKGISNELMLNILNSCNKPYKISMLGLFNPVNIPIFFLQNAGFIGDIKLNDSLKRDYAKKLLANENVSKDAIPGILQNMKEGNSKLIEIALNSKDFDFNTLPAILRNTLYDSGFYVNGQKSVSTSRVKFVESLMKNPEFPNDCIADVIWCYGRENVSKKFVENLCFNKDFPAQQIKPLVEAIIIDREGAYYLFNTSEPKFKHKLAERLVNDEKCPNEHVADIISSISKEQSGLFEQIYADDNVPKSEISSILYLDYGVKKGFDKLNFSNKIIVLTNSISVSDKTLIYLKKYNIDKAKIDDLVNKISMEMGLKRENIYTSDEKKQILFKNYIANNSNVEQLASNVNLQKYSNGIPMKYTRAQFTKDLNDLMFSLSPEDKISVQNYFSINIENGHLEGFPIIPKHAKAIKKELLPIVEKIKEKIINFTQKNETDINNPELKNLFDSIIQGCPEFATVVGKIQHGTHQYTVDIHTLKVLQNAFKDPEYKKLDDESKTVLKFAILLHDIGKKEGVIDKSHYETSAKYAVSILEKYNLTPRVKSKIIETIYNHHWFEQYNKSEISANVVNAIFRTPQALQLGMIMAKADLAGVSGSFHYKITKTHNEKEFNEYFDKKRDELFVQQNARYKNLNLVMDTKFSQTKQRKFPTQRVLINGKEHEVPVLNLTDETLSNDLYEYGFAKGITRKTARFFAHFNDKIKGLKVFMALSSSPTTESVQSLSMISLDNSRAFKNQIYGVITDIDMANVAQASNTNISSGYKKDLKHFAKDLYSFWELNTYVRDNFINELDKSGINLTKDEYAKLSKYIVDIQYSTQITKDIKIGNKTIPAELLQKALNESRERLFDGSLHSEIVAINPRVKALVARVSSLDECSQEFLELAAENELPIILIGHNERHTNK